MLQEAASTTRVNEPAADRRPVMLALARGFRGHCPRCGNGFLFNRYLKAVAACSACGEDMSHQRADDAPPYFTIILVGHLIVPAMLFVGMRTDWPTASYLAIWIPLTLVMALTLLQPIKGATIALQWALGMHGFDGSTDADAPAPVIGRRPN